MYREKPAPAPLAIVVLSSRVFALDRLSGQRVWNASIPLALWSRLAVTDDRVVVASGSALTCLGYADGAKLWETRTPIDTETLVVDGAQVLVASAGEVACFALETGAFLWQDTFKGMGVGPVSLGFPGNTASVDRA